ncbi:hypothetical protein [Miltoncostaea oceani]|nr:hypothetical protein [Miltoncostaea oceani]
MVRFVDDGVCVVLAHGLYVHLPIDAVRRIASTGRASTPRAV